MQMYCLENGQLLNRLFRQPKFQPHTVTITIRYSDWWFWEYDHPLRMSELWLATFNGSKGLRELRVEYEQLSRKKEEMMKIVLRNKEWKLDVGALDASGVDMEGYLSADNTNLETWTWKGTSKLDGQEWAHHGDGDTIEYVVVTDTWIFIAGPMPQEDADKRVQLSFSEDDYSYSDEDYDEENDSDQEDSDGFEEVAG